MGGDKYIEESGLLEGSIVGLVPGYFLSGPILPAGLPALIAALLAMRRRIPVEDVIHKLLILQGLR
jgi:hypothetical protein